VVDAPHLFARPGNPYLGPDGRDWDDNALRFAALARAGADIACGAIPSFVPDIVHGHDWQAGLAMAYLAFRGTPVPRSVMTIHNLAYQGTFPADLFPRLGLPPQAYAIDGVEFYGGVGYLKAGLYFADALTTVSPTYAREIQTPEFGCGLDGLLRARYRVLTGIANGIDTDVWNPATDTTLFSRYRADSLEGRGRNKAFLQNRFGLEPDDTRMLFGIVSRFVWQKGIDILGDCIPGIVASGAQIVLLGSGDRDLETRLLALAKATPDAVGCVVGYDEALAHQIQAGVDALLVPSRFEPCGLTQLCALRYGAVPVVARVGGLADTVVDANEAGGTGVQFLPVSVAALSSALNRTTALWRDKERFAAVQRNAMAADVSWAQPARRYARLYAGLAAKAG
jgi:starch synthase